MGLEDLMKSNGKQGKRLVMTPDMERVLSLPSVPPGMFKPSLPIPKGSPHFTLNTVQQRALAAISKSGGLLGSIGVGHGKSFIGLLAGACSGAQTTALLVEPGLVPPMLKQYQILCNLYGKVYQPNPLYMWDDKNAETYTGPKTVLVPYSILSSQGNHDILDRLRPQLIFADEGQALASLDSARGKRVQRYREAYPDTKLAIASGSITAKSISDYAHLSYWALGNGSPLPLPGNKQELEVWSRCLDSRIRRDTVPTDVDWRCMEALVEQCAGHSAEDFRTYDAETKRGMARQAFFVRFSHTPGVILTEESSASMSLNLFGFQVHSENKEYTGLIKGVRNGKVNELEGMTITEDNKHNVLRQLALGFAYIPVWDTEDGKPHKLYRLSQRRWSAVLNKVLPLDIRGWDTDGMIRRNLEKGVPVPMPIVIAVPDIQTRWEFFEEQKANGPSEHKVVWYDTSWMVELVEMLHKVKDQTIVWYEHKAVGDMLRSFLPTFGEGDTIPEDYNSHIAASISAHGKGNNLQAWARNIVLEVPAGGKAWEQLLGRTHRQGQEEDKVEAFVNQTQPEQRRAFKQALGDAQYLQATHGSKQKLLLSTKIDLPS